MTSPETPPCNVSTNPSIRVRPSNIVQRRSCSTYCRDLLDQPALQAVKFVNRTVFHIRNVEDNKKFSYRRCQFGFVHIFNEFRTFFLGWFQRYLIFRAKHQNHSPFLYGHIPFFVLQSDSFQNNLLAVGLNA